MDESGEHQSQQTDTRTEIENQILYALINKELNDENTWTHRGEQHTLGSYWGIEGGRRERIRKNN